MPAAPPLRARRGAALALAAFATLLTLAGTACTKTDPVVDTGQTGTTAPPATAPRATGGTGTTSGTSATGPAGSAATTSTTPPTGASSTTAPSSSSTPTTAPGNEAAKTFAFCAKVKELDETTMGTNDPTGAGYLTVLKQAFAQLVPLAPDAIKAPLETMNTYLQGITTVEQMMADPPPAVQAASDQLSSWSDANCGNR